MKNKIINIKLNNYRSKEIKFFRLNKLKWSRDLLIIKKKKKIKNVFHKQILQHTYILHALCFSFT